MKTEPVISRLARAKINLDLLITGQRDDGYHLLDSLVVFADYGDVINVTPADQLTLDVTGPFADKLQNDIDNLVLQAAHRLKDHFKIQQGAAISLVKNLPVASGIGGGSADAAATIEALLELWGMEDKKASLGDLPLSLGADVPICMTSKTLNMKGIGDIQTPVALEFPLYLLLVNPGVSVSTAHIFRRRAERQADFSPPRFMPDEIHSMSELVAMLRNSRNDLEDDAREVQAEITSALHEIEKSENCLFSAMSGSGATCFGLFATAEEAQNAEADFTVKKPNWWIKAVCAC